MDGAVRYLCIPKWDKYQEKRTNAKGETWKPPWFKVYGDSSLDYKLSQLTLRERGVLVEMWKLANRLDNQIPYDALWIARAANTSEDISDDLETLISRGFVCSSVEITEGLQYDDPLEESREEESREESPNGDVADAVRAVFDHWKVARNKHRARLTDGRRRKIKKRLQSFSEDELMRAIDALALDPWEDRSRYDELAEHIFRNDEQVEKWLAVADNPPKKDSLSVEDIRNLE